MIKNAKTALEIAQSAPMLAHARYVAINSTWIMENASCVKRVTTLTQEIRNVRHVPQTAKSARTVIPVKNVKEPPVSMQSRRHADAKKDHTCETISVPGKNVAMESKKTQ